MVIKISVVINSVHFLIQSFPKLSICTRTYVTYLVTDSKCFDLIPSGYVLIVVLCLVKLLSLFVVLYQIIRIENFRLCFDVAMYIVADNNF